MSWKKLACFAGGILFGTAGVSILSSKDAKKAYTHCTAAVLRGKDSVMKRATIIKENCQDIHDDAVDINEKRYAEEEEREVAIARAMVEAYEEKKKAEKKTK
ncbi:MAG: DUF6110 family protein [Lachnospiraceae bacterium]|nr:DUF6110 family protein [Lachnospiraceae bacterium]